MEEPTPDQNYRFLREGGGPGGQKPPPGIKNLRENKSIRKPYVNDDGDGGDADDDADDGDDEDEGRSGRAGPRSGTGQTADDAGDGDRVHDTPPRGNPTSR